MTYTPITDKEGMKDAMARLRDLFRRDAEEIDNKDNTECLTHSKLPLRGEFNKKPEPDGRYWIKFMRTKGGNYFSANMRPKELETASSKRTNGLIVKNEEGHRFLTHNGRFDGIKQSSKKFRQSTDADHWIEVEKDPESRFLVAQIDDISTPNHIQQIREVLDVVLDFKIRNTSSTPPPPESHTEDPSMQNTPKARNTILYGPPGTGKTYATARRCVEICGGTLDEKAIHDRYKKLVEEGRVVFITFHQSYGYEDFVEGLRPETRLESTSGFGLVPKPGVLKRIADDARKNPTQPYVLVIDEINRANISKAMGELITLLEEDKREGSENEVAVTLPYSGEQFTLPANLHILGTMNTADRSIALLDTALRRRLRFEELSPEPKQLEKNVEGIKLRKVLQAINERLEYLIDRDHLVGHAWFMGAKTKADVNDVMRHKVIPLIADYFYDNWRKVQAVLGGYDDFVQSRKLERPPGLEEEDAYEDRYSWTVTKEAFPPEAYNRLINGKRSGGEGED